MHALIVGAGDLGFFLAKLLQQENHEVTVIELNEEACKKISDAGIVVVRGDASEPKTLEKAGIEKTDVLVALTSNPQTNTVIALLGKELGAKKVAVQAWRAEYSERELKKLGIDFVVYPKAVAAGFIFELITKPRVLEMALISRGETEIIELTVLKNSGLNGKKVSEIEEPAGSAIIALRENNRTIVLDSNLQIMEGMKLVIFAKKETAEKIKKMTA